ncbi:MAG: nucleotidyl transferase AbiEii/AbiGii toxin family protein [Bacteroidota bacterium]
MFTESREDALQREILQTKLLSSIFTKAAKNEVVLKGGMAMRVSQGSHRKTKDIDLGQHPGIPLPKLQKLMRSAIKQTLSSGILEKYEVSEPKQTDTTARWKINGQTKGKTRVQLTVEVSRRGVPTPENLETVEYFPPDEYKISPFLVDVYNGKTLAATKVIAMLQENRVAPRDLYDLHILIRNEVTPPSDLLSDVDEEVLGESLEKLWDKIDMLDYDMFVDQVAPYLPKGVADRIDKNVYEEMRVEVGVHVEKWLNDAIENKRGLLL